MRHNFLQNQLLGPGRLVMYIVFSLFTGNSFSSNFKSLHNVMSRFPNLLKYSCSVDHYSPWPFEAYVNIARVWLQDTKSKVSGNKSLFSKCLQCSGLRWGANWKGSKWDLNQHIIQRNKSVFAVSIYNFLLHKEAVEILDLFNNITYWRQNTNSGCELKHWEKIKIAWKPQLGGSKIIRYLRKTCKMTLTLPIYFLPGVHSMAPYT